MAPVTIEPELLAKLTSNGGKVPLTDVAGKTVGYFVSLDRLTVLEKALDAQLYDEPTAEEIRRALANPKRHSMEEVMKLVEGE